MKGSTNTIQEDVKDLQNPEFTESAEVVNIRSGESIFSIFGKIRKWFSFISDYSITFNPIRFGDYEDFTGLENGGLIDTEYFECPKTGIYIVYFIVAQCGADSITAAGAHWLAALKDLDGGTAYPVSGGRAAQIIPIGQTWDSCSTVSSMYVLNAGQQYKVTFQNASGIRTNTTYNSRISVLCVFFR